MMSKHRFGNRKTEHHHNVISSVIITVIIIILIPYYYRIIIIINLSSFACNSSSLCRFGCDVAEDNGETEPCGDHRQDVGKATIFDKPAEFLGPQRCL